jgi:hypothetical protein
MRWTLGLLLLGAVGCGSQQTKMVACPETGCPPTYASSSPQGLPGPTENRPAHEPMPMATLPPAEPAPPAPIVAPPPDVPPPSDVTPPPPEPAPLP